MKKLIFILSICMLLSSCESNTIDIDSNNLLIGHWVNPEYENEITTFKRGNSLPDQAYGISFLANGNLIERTSGFYGTPPLTFFNQEGSFSLDNGLINIANNSFLSQYNLRIISLTETELVVKRELSEQEIEHRALMDVYNEIYALAYSQPCSNSEDWTYTAYGAKACGGPQGYIPYSKKIDTVAFLQKVENYTQTEKSFNIKWVVVSDCALVNPPNSIECRNNYPVLKN